MDTQLEAKKKYDFIDLQHSNGIWYPKVRYEGILSFQRNFEAKEGDIMLATLPKSGTTWLKALVFSIVNRDIYPLDQSPLLTSNPHQLVPHDGALIPEARSQEWKHIRSKIYGTHIPYQELPGSILDSKCKIVYLCRNPLDQFISWWHFRKHFEKANQPLPLEDAFQLFFEGKHNFGPFWNHMLGYWDASLKHPEYILFLKYEDLKQDIVRNVKKIAHFIGCPFSEDEKGKGKIEDIAQLCSFQNLQNLEVNKTGEVSKNLHLKNSIFFRKGEVGDWVNYISPRMVDYADKVIAEKFGESGLTFGSYISKEVS